MRFQQLPWFAMLTLTPGFFLGKRTIITSFPPYGRREY